VCFLANHARRLCVGMTNDLVARLGQHRAAEVTTYVGRYGITRLVRAEAYATPMDAIRREKQVKSWTRARKIALIESENPQWRDLTELALEGRMLS
jgi:putative endonuclease